MSVVFAVIFLVSGIPLILGLIKPRLVIFWGRPEERSRRRVLLSYGVASILFLFLAMSLSGAGSTTDSSATGIGDAAGKFVMQLKLLRNLLP